MWQCGSSGVPNEALHGSSATAMHACKQTRRANDHFVSALVSASVCTGVTCFIYAEHAWLGEPCATAKAGTLPMLGIHRRRCRTISVKGRITRQPQTCTCFAALQVEHVKERDGAK